jgi:hypothetical protein
VLRLEEYVARRKKEDRLDEFDVNVRAENLRICVNYVFEYFNNYLDITAAENKTVLQNEKIEKYRKQLREYDPEIQDWLVGINSDHGSYLNRAIGFILDQDVFFFLYNTDQEFRSLSYDCYSKLIKKYSFLRDQTEMLFLFIKNYHQIRSQQAWPSELPFISEDINDWINNTWIKYQVNIMAFADNWIDYFFDHQELWPSTHKIETVDPWRKYEYNFRQGRNLFNLNSLYVKIPKKSFTRRKKQEFEILMMYFWLHHIVGDDEGYWQEYLERVLPAMNKD